MARMNVTIESLVRCAALAVVAGCASGPRYKDKAMDFAAVKTVAVLPLQNLSHDTQAPDRVRSVFSNSLLATGSVYVLPQGEVMRALGKAGVATPPTPTKDDVVNLGKALAVEAVFVGTLKEYGEVRSGNTSANVISMSLEMIETTTGKVVWSASTTKGGIGVWDRLFGGGGEPMNEVTEEAVRDLVAKLFK